MTAPLKPQQAWYRMTPEEVARLLQVDPAVGLSTAEAQQRLQQAGPNKLAGKKKETGLQAFLRQYQDFMQLVLLGAAAVSLLVTRDWTATLLLAGLTVLNAVLGLRQESKAEASLAALTGMLRNIARVRRDNQAIEIDAEELAPGDIVLMEAGNRVPADGRLFLTATLEIEEAALTGESAPTLKDVAAIEREDVGLGDRLCMAFMNTSVTRGRGEMIVTTTGMDTEIGHIAELLNKTEADKTPLQKQIDKLMVNILMLAGATLVLMIANGLLRGYPFHSLFIAGIALAVAAVPTAMPAVITTLYSMGTRALAAKNAIVKRLPSVETLGSVSAICSDKTGTLTLNKMTARELIVPPNHRFRVTGEGYSTQGQLLHTEGTRMDLSQILQPMALCADARLDGETLIGDPTEGALIVLAEKGSIDVMGARESYPRVAEVPFDSDYKFMATFHNMADEQGRPVVRCYVKGAPDVLIARGRYFWMPDGRSAPIGDETRQLALDANSRMAGSGERVMVVARRDFDPQTFDPNGSLIELVNDLTLLGMVGIVDPPRPEARDAIAKCKSAGIQVRMITGDHAVTAAAIGRELGIEGAALTGAQFAAASDVELSAQLPGLGVVARVAPEDKIRLVELLQKQDNIVAMTGDGVNDAPALKKADIGVAMGITGTEVSKEAAVMILTDDNFATIVTAIEYGRALYHNLSKYIRFQLETLIGFIATFLGASLFAIAGGMAFAPLALLWINFFIQAPVGIALGYDTPPPDLMQHRPRPLQRPIFTRAEWLRIALLGLIIAAGTLFLRVYYAPIWGDAVAATMSLTAFSLLSIAAGLSARDETRSLFRRDLVWDRLQLLLYGMALAMTLLATEMGLLQRGLRTTSLSGRQWLICIGTALLLLAVDEAIKYFMRRRRERPTGEEPAAVVDVGEPARAAG